MNTNQVKYQLVFGRGCFDTGDNSVIKINQDISIFFNIKLLKPFLTLNCSPYIPLPSPRWNVEMGIILRRSERICEAIYVTCAMIKMFRLQRYKFSTLSHCLACYQFISNPRNIIYFLYHYMGVLEHKLSTKCSTRLILHKQLFMILFTHVLY